MSDRVGILREGRLVQEGPPDTLYDRPASIFAATFLGDANILEGAAEAGRIRLGDGAAVTARAGTEPAAGPAFLAVRPERIAIRPADAPAPAGEAENTLHGRVAKRVFAGASITYLVDWNGRTLKVFAQNSGMPPIAEGEKVLLSWSADSTIPVAAE